MRSHTSSSTIEILEARIAPATFTVLNLNDAGGGSLRQAVLDANDTAAADTIVFKTGLAGTITLGAATGQIIIEENLTIKGPGPDKVRIDAGNLSRIFDITNGTPAVKSVAISGLALLNGSSDGGGAIRSTESLALSRMYFQGNDATGPGGAVCVDTAGKFSMTASQVFGNTTTNNGGGLFILASQGITVSKSIFANNQADIGGGLYLDANGPAARAATVRIDRTTVSGNRATDGHGGGAFLDNDTAGGSGRVIVSASTFTANNATDSGGGLSLESGHYFLQKLSVASNTAARLGGGVGDTGSASLTIKGGKFIGNETTQASAIGGGALHAAGLGKVEIAGALFASNRSASEGGAIVLGATTVEAKLSGNTISGNTSTTTGGALAALSNSGLTVVSGLFAGNRAGTEGGAIFGGTTEGLVIQRATFSSNASLGDGVVTSGDGGAISAGNDTDLTLTGTKFLQNSAGDNGGAVSVGGTGVLLAKGAIFTDNVATNAGGGIFRFGSGALTIEKSKFTANHAATGGGIDSNGSGAFLVKSSRIIGNSAVVADGGGIELLLSSGNVDIIATVISQNTAATNGGGLALGTGGLKKITKSTISSNVASTGDGGGVFTTTGPALTVTSTKITGNSAADQGGGIRNGTGAPGGFTLVGGSVTGNIAALDPDIST